MNPRAFRPAFLRRILPALSLLLACPPDATAQPTFSPPEIVADGAANYRLTRNPGAQAAFDSSGTLHAVYWTGGTATNPNGSPSFILYRSWTPAEGWSAEEAIDDSESAGQHVGGREPSLAVAPDGTVWIAWHDHRHSTAAGNWIDNIEIYADSKAPGGAFSAGDLRLTTSSAAHAGDNGFLPRIAAAADGRLSVAWHDFHFDGAVSDIFLKTSDGSGAFDLGEPMASMRLTDQADRGGSPPYVTPDLAVSPDGTRHLAWTAEFGGAQDLFYAEVPVGASSVSEEVLASGATSFFDPPRIAAAPNGDVWIAYADQSAFPETATLLRRRAGQASFDPPAAVSMPLFDEAAPDLAIDASGQVHLAWIDERSGRHVRYGRFDPAAGALAEDVQVTASAGDWERPSLSLDGNGGIAILWEEDITPFQSAVWFSTTIAPAAVERWEAYE